MSRYYRLTEKYTLKITYGPDPRDKCHRNLYAGAPGGHRDSSHGYISFYLIENTGYVRYNIVQWHKYTYALNRKLLHMHTQS